MRLLKSIAVAFSMYSSIPMPRFKWGSDDMKYHLIFFPWIGAVIAVIEYLWRYVCDMFDISQVVLTLISIAIPLIVTGGFHLDGYMDTSDALSSYQDRTRRLEILKDSHIGAFSVIRLVVYGLLMFASVFSMNEMAYYAWIMTFFISRALSGICVIGYKKAKSSGSLSTESATASSKVVMISLAIQIVIVAVIVGHFLGYFWTAALAGVLVALLYYLYIAYSKFGGITGDLAGWFVCQAELVSAIFVAVLSVL